jgi:hypothetical protein
VSNPRVKKVCDKEEVQALNRKKNDKPQTRRGEETRHIAPVSGTRDTRGINK